MSEKAPKHRWPQYSLRALFTTTLVCGLWQVFVSLAVLPVVPHIQLDHVLSPAELKDAATTKRTLEILQRAHGDEWPFWLVPGLVTSVASTIGLVTVRRQPPDPACTQS